MELKTFRKGDVIIEKGSYGTFAYVIKSGRVEVSDIVNHKKIVLGILEEGQIFGEMGLVDDQPRSATVTALEDVQLAVLSRDRFNDLFEKNPKMLLPIIKALFERLRTVNRKLMSKEAPDIVETDKCEYPHDTELVVLSGLNESSSEALGGKQMNISKFPFRVGRKHELDEADVLSGNDLYLQGFPPFNVSRNHFLIGKEGGRYIVVDRGSHLGTIVNGKKIHVQHVLHRKENEIIAGPRHSPFVFKLEIR